MGKYKLVSGEKYGEWTVVVAGKKKSLCRCSCGNECYVPNRNLLLGKSKRCRPCAICKPLNVGARFGNWTVLKYSPHRSLCQCDCGTNKMVLNGSLRNGGTRMCWECQHKGHGCRSFGLSKSTNRKLKLAISDAIRRCISPKEWCYDGYGGRGIGVFADWLRDKNLFLAYLATLDGHDDPDLWLDRIDNNRGYEPGNLRFVTPKESAQNRRSRCV